MKDKPTCEKCKKECKEQYLHDKLWLCESCMDEVYDEEDKY